MNSIRTQNFKIVAKKILFLCGYIVFFIATLEVGSWFALKIYGMVFSSQTTNSLLTKDDVMKELLNVQSEPEFFPTRWYTNKPNYRGKFVITDESGFRINKDVLKGEKSIGFFGGSTMFSVITEQSGTIPDLINIRGYDSLNFGIGGYSTTAELPTFIEATRKYPMIEVAIFYDGVNEIGRMAEEIQDKPSPGLFRHVGFYYRPMAASSVNGLTPTSIKIPDSSLVKILRKLWQFTPRNQDSVLSLDLEKASGEIVDLYFANIDDIQKLAVAKGITTIFIWQPNLFTTRKSLSANEAKIKAKEKNIVALLAPIVHQKLVSDPRFHKYKIVDMTDSFDGLGSELFYDWCHITAEGNKIVADKILQKIKYSGLLK